LATPARTLTATSGAGILSPVRTLTRIMFPFSSVVNCCPRCAMPFVSFSIFSTWSRGLVFKAHRWLYHSTLGSRVIKKKKLRVWGFHTENHLNLD